MNGLIPYMFDMSKIEQPYESRWDYYSDYTSLINLKLIHCLTREHAGSKDRSMTQGFFQSANEFLDMLVKTSAIFEYDVSDDAFAEDLEECEYHIEYRRRLTINADVFLPDIFMKSAFGLGKFEYECIMLAFLTSLDPKYEKIFPLLNDNASRKQPTLDIALKLFGDSSCKPFDYIKYFSPGSTLFNFFLIRKDSYGTASLSLPLQLQSRISNYLSDPYSTTFEFDIPWDYFEPTSAVDDMIINRQYFDKMVHIYEASQLDSAKRFCLFNLYGLPGSGRKTLFRHFCKVRDKMCMIVDCSLLSNDKDKLRKDILYICREAILKQAFIYLDNFNVLTDLEYGPMLSLTVLDTLSERIGNVFIASEDELKSTCIPSGVSHIPIGIPNTDEESRYILWKNISRQKHFEKSVDFHQLSTKFKFTPGQILRSMEHAVCETDMECAGQINEKILYECCYRQIVHTLGENASKIAPAYTWDDIVLPEKEIDTLKAACNHVKFSHKVLFEWGFDKKLPYGRGLAILFSGPPGTGKTMSAQVIAGELHMEMYKIQLSKIVSKYIGETEKNLKSIFDEAKKSNVILFFDETDALFGKRTEVKDSHDRYANIEVAYLLQQIEEHEGITIMATNYLENIDEAFLRRINYVVHFPFPDCEVRKKIWMKMLPALAPVSGDIDFDFLARKFEVSGGNIKNIVLSAAFLAASENMDISMPHLITSAIHELKKNKKVVLRESLEEYADLYD